MTLQSMARSIYRDAPVLSHLAGVVDEAWRLLPESENNDEVDLDDLNMFIPTERFFATRRDRIRLVISALELLETMPLLEMKVVSGRYTEGLPLVDRHARRLLLAHLKRFVGPAQ
jgi:hypothetical protein